MADYEAQHRYVKNQSDGEHVGQWDGRSIKFAHGETKYLPDWLVHHLIGQSYVNGIFRLVAVGAQETPKVAVETIPEQKVHVCKESKPDGSLCGAKFDEGSQELIDHLVSHKHAEDRKPEVKQPRAAKKE